MSSAIASSTQAIGTLGFLSQAGYVLTAGHVSSKDSATSAANEPSLTGSYIEPIKILGLPSEALGLDDTVKPYAFRLCSSDMDMMLIKCNSIKKDEDFADMRKAFLAKTVKNSDKVSGVDVQWFDDSKKMLTKRIPFHCDELDLQVIVQRDGKAVGVKCSHWSVDHSMQKHDNAVALVKYIHAKLAGDHLRAGDSGAPLVLSMNGIRVVLGFLRGMFKDPILGAGLCNFAFHYSVS